MPRLSKRQMAVAVAEDVLKRLRRRKNPIVACPGWYVSAPYQPLSIGSDLQDHVDAMVDTGRCRVCALGAALLSKAKLFDKVPSNSIFTQTYGGPTVWTNQHDVRENLKDVFSLSVLKRMEAAFEVSYRVVGGDSVSGDVYGAVVFGSQFQDPKKRMRAIMENVVANGGEFVVNRATKTQADDVIKEFCDDQT